MTQAIAHHQSQASNGRNHAPGRGTLGLLLATHPRAAQPRCFSVDDYDRMIATGVIQEGERVELIEGAIIEMAAMGSRHAGCVNRLNRLLSRLWLERIALVNDQTPIQLSDSEPQPDIAVVRYRTDDYSFAHPTRDDTFFLIEVSYSSVGTDRREKVPMYAREAIPEIWLVNLDAEVVEVYRNPSGGRYHSITRYSRGATVSPLAFPDLSLEVADILRPPGITEES